MDDEIEHMEMGMDSDMDMEITSLWLMERKGQGMFGITRLLRPLGGIDPLGNAKIPI